MLGYAAHVPVGERTTAFVTAVRPALARMVAPPPPAAPMARVPTVPTPGPCRSMSPRQACGAVLGHPVELQTEVGQGVGVVVELQEVR